MTKSIQTVIESLGTFVPEDEVANVERLYKLFDGFRQLPGREAAMPAMFSLLERFPVAEFGSPGPLVSELEAIPGYETLLVQSVARQPTYLTIWMMNRILNVSSTEEHERWLFRLEASLHHPLAPEQAREEARLFIQHQIERRAEQSVQHDRREDAAPG